MPHTLFATANRRPVSSRSSRGDYTRTSPRTPIRTTRTEAPRTIMRAAHAIMLGVDLAGMVAAFGYGMASLYHGLPLFNVLGAGACFITLGMMALDHYRNG